MGEHWSKKKGVVSGRQAQQHAAQKARAHQFKQARKGRAAPPAYQAASTGCLVALLLVPVAAVRRWLA